MDNKKVKHILSIVILAFLLYFSVILYITFSHYKKINRINHQNDLINEKKAKEKAISFLKQKYGDGDFKIIKTHKGNICQSCQWLSKIDGYEFTVNTSYMNSTFIISITDDFSIKNDPFLNEYYREKNEIYNLTDYINKNIIEQYNEIISQNFNATINFETMELDYQNDFGKIPTLEELSNMAVLYNPKFEINEVLANKEDLLNYLIKLTKFFIENFNTSNIKFDKDSKYFRYKYDFSKMGINNSYSQYDGYEGYVFAGEYKYSQELGGYTFENEDSVVRINILGEVTILKINDILNS